MNAPATFPRQPTIVGSIKRTVAAMPALDQVELIRALAAEFSWSYGFDQIDAGIDRIAADLRDEQLVAERGLEAIGLLS